MPDNEREALLAYVDEVISATSAGKIKWREVNPTTFVWEIVEPKRARVLLQRLERQTGKIILSGGKQKPETFLAYNFQVIDATGSAVVNLTSSEDDHLSEKLDRLFQLIRKGMSDKILEFLRGTLPK